MESAIDTNRDAMRRTAAAFIALVAWAGLVIQFDAVLGRTESWAGAAWVMVAYFTVVTNLVVAVTFTGIAAGLATFASPRLAAGLSLSILLVGCVYHLLLRGLLELSGGDLTADWILHTVTPVLVSLYWILSVRKGALTRRDPLLWSLYPLVYLVYALGRGAIEGRYAYPFIDVRALGWPATLVNAVVIALGFLAAGYALVWLDRRLGQPDGRASL